jgi:hypothetical protein
MDFTEETATMFLKEPRKVADIIIHNTGATD